MSDNKKYYYLKLKDDYFDSDDLIVLENMPDGYLYSNILLKLYLRSLKNEGKLMFKDRIPYNSNILAQITRHSVGVMEKAIQIFNSLGLIEIMDNGAIYLLDIQNYIGESSTEADRKRSYRLKIDQEKRNQLPEGQMSGQSGDIYPPEIEKEIDLEKDKETELKEKCPAAPYEKIKIMFNSICKSFPKIKTLSAKRKTGIKMRWNQYNYDLNVFDELFTIAENSDFLKGDNNRNWKADFDWLINENNMAKVLENKYENKLDKKATTENSVNKYGW